MYFVQVLWCIMGWSVFDCRQTEQSVLCCSKLACDANWACVLAAAGLQGSAEPGQALPGTAWGRRGDRPRRLRSHVGRFSYDSGIGKLRTIRF